jgi:hypothetical protein
MKSSFTILSMLLGLSVGPLNAKSDPKLVELKVGQDMMTFRLSESGAAWLTHIESPRDKSLQLSAPDYSALGKVPAKICHRALRWAKAAAAGDFGPDFAARLRQDIRVNNQFPLRASILPALNPTRIEARLAETTGQASVRWQNPLQLNSFNVAIQLKDESITPILGMDEALTQQVEDLFIATALTGEASGFISAGDLYCDLHSQQAHITVSATVRYAQPTTEPVSTTGEPDSDATGATSDTDQPTDEDDVPPEPQPAFIEQPFEWQLISGDSTL